MADRKLVDLFKNALQPLDLEQAEKLVCKAKEQFGEIPTFFGMPVYQNPVGIEIEAENFEVVPIPPLYWATKDDTSLKKNGVEFVSIPLRGRNIDYALVELDKMTKANKLTFGHRTSVHVHCNVNTFWVSQLKALLATYACAENLFFGFVNETRRANTFCYRLVGTPAEIVFYEMDKEGSECTKYCAFNIQPIRRQMTVEFRHLEGTQDRKRLRRWIQLCSKLVGSIEEMGKGADEVVIKALVENRMPDLIFSIWGDVGAKLFDEGEVKRSVNNGALWAMSLLTNKTEIK